jgi:hypothetical protein
MIERITLLSINDGYLWKHRSGQSKYPGAYRLSFDSGKTWAITIDQTMAAKPWLQSTWSISHGHDVKKYLGPVGSTQPNIGGAFYTERTSFTETGCTNWNLNEGQFSTRKNYKGSIFPVDPGIFGYPILGPVSNLALSGYGNTARSRIDPANPNGNLLVAIGELFNDGLPTITGAQTWKTRAKEARAAGHEYLNVEFGWKPLVSDIRATALNVKSAAQLLRQREKNLARPLRRRYHFPTIHDESTSVFASNVWPEPAGSVSQFGSSAGKGDVLKSSILDWDVWFSGSFTYYVSPGSYSSRLLMYEAQADALLGTRLTPETVWNLAPWSWAIDWHVDFGAMLGNISRMILDGSVMWYGYVMSRQVRQDTYSHTSWPISMTLNKVIKQRAMATPFGFGLDPDTDYSARQIAIIAALGITRL